MEINYNTLENEVFHLLGDKKIMVLATSFDNVVTARNMSCLIINKKIYLQTDKTFTKYKQVVQNPKVALCVDNIQIEGTARIKKHPFDEENKEFHDLFKEKYKGSYEKYSHMKNEVVLEIEPVFITLWKYENTQPYRDLLDIGHKKAFRETYDTSL